MNESDFVMEHIAGRLSTMEVPVEWLSFTPNRKTLHLLDHPYLFKASSLVDYFRSINLHRMRKAYETAVNYNSRVSVMMASGRLMNDPSDRKYLLTVSSLIWIAVGNVLTGSASVCVLLLQSILFWKSDEIEYSKMPLISCGGGKSGN